jgi:hypothetical protein
VAAGETIAYMAFSRFCIAVWGHWEARFGTTFTVILAVVQYLALALVSPANVPTWVRDFPPYLWLAIGAILFFWSCYEAWHDEYDGRRQAENRTEEVINSNRPEVFVSLDFGPHPYDQEHIGERTYAFVGVSNKGQTYAKNVRIDPVEIDGRTFTFAELQFVNPSQRLEPDFAWAGNEWSVKQWDAFIDVLRRIAEKRITAESPDFERITFPLKVSWEDSFGNKFCSSSEIEYIHPQQKCRTRHGPIVWLSSSKQP